MFIWTCFRIFWIFWYAYRKIQKKETYFFSLQNSAKKQFFAVRGGGAENVTDRSVIFLFLNLLLPTIFCRAVPVIENRLILTLQKPPSFSVSIRSWRLQTRGEKGCSYAKGNCSCPRVLEQSWGLQGRVLSRKWGPRLSTTGSDNPLAG